MVSPYFPKPPMHGSAAGDFAGPLPRNKPDLPLPEPVAKPQSPARQRSDSIFRGLPVLAPADRPVLASRHSQTGRILQPVPPESIARRVPRARQELPAQNPRQTDCP